MLIDTDVLIWLLRGEASARRTVSSLIEPALSVVTWMELVQGMRDKRELQLLRRTTREQRWRILPLDEAIGHRAALYVESYSLSHGIKLADALIAASAVENAMPLLTGNARHFKVIPELELHRYRV